MFKNEGKTGKIVAQKQVYAGPIFQLDKQKIETPDGLLVNRDVIVHQTAVTILAFTSDQHVLLNTEYRVGVNAESLSLPAGLINANETAEEAAKRELLEETGYEATKVQELTIITASEGFSTEKVILVVAQINPVKKAAQHFDADEFVNSQLIRYDHLKQLIKQGRIRSAQAIATVGYYEMFGG